MKLLLALGLNLALLVWLSGWLRQQAKSPAGAWLWPTLLLKLLATLASVLALSADAAYFQLWAGRMNEQAWANPLAWFRMLPTDAFHFGPHHLVFHGLSNTLFLIKVLSGLNFASGGLVWLNAGYLSLFHFVGSWRLVQALSRAFPGTPPAAPVAALLLWPSCVYWTSGLTKESLLVGSAAWLTALVVEELYPPAPAGRKSRLLAALGLAILVFKMRFFFAVFLLTGLGTAVGIRVGQHLGFLRRRWAQMLVLAAVVGVGSTLAGEVLPAFRANKFTSQLMRNYSELEAESRGRPHLEYPQLKPTQASVAQHAPVAVLNSLTRPWLGESRHWKYLAAGLENLLLLGLLLTALVAVARGRAGQLPFTLVMVLLFYCVVVAVLIGLTTPNLGTLNRYRTAFLPFLLLLLLQNDYAAAWLRRLSWPRR
ncbi:hypothetical protein HER32_19395 [Hymenobacter sp. BT18]|uniref:hypothetical protein n=1 Tax=Hymenobacter sp. BT18 TaxID=2835648 RepID=UPI00143E27F4|nr:hypothetical protein [Hymenobacter sp. BT18]QIX63219.1 hypothetical protein HER32_19395 [Hymenobacter sp. BT18]